MLPLEGSHHHAALEVHFRSSYGKWEAWMFANWYPGARRFWSFREMMEHEREGFNRLRTNRAGPDAAPDRGGTETFQG